MARIFIVAGGKGGVGKSVTSIALLDYFETRNRKVTLIETDTSNPDVGKAYQKDVKGFHLVNLDDHEGWLELLDFVDGAKTGDIVINTAARNSDGVNQFGGMFDEQMAQLGWPVVSLFVVNGQRDSLELLADYRNAMSKGALHVIRNQFFAKGRNTFDLYDKSEVRHEIAAAGGGTYDLPLLAARVSSQVQSNRLTMQKAWAGATLGSKAEIERWRRACALNIFDEVCADGDSRE